MALLFKLPSQEILDKCNNIKPIVALPSMKEIIYDESKSKYCYINDWFKEDKIGVAIECTHYFSYGLLGRQKKHGLKNCVSLKKYVTMGNNLPFMAIIIS